MQVSSSAAAAWRAFAEFEQQFQRSPRSAEGLGLRGFGFGSRV